MRSSLRTCRLLAEKGGGRPPFSRDFLLKALIYRALRRIHSLNDLVFELKNNPSALAACARRCFEENSFSRVQKMTFVKPYIVNKTPNVKIKQQRQGNYFQPKFRRNLG